jgi:hypothetical protein
MVDVTILWDDGTAFLVSLEDVDSEDAVDSVFDMIRSADTVYGRFVSAEGVPQEQARFCKFFERGIRAVMTDSR